MEIEYHRKRKFHKLQNLCVIFNSLQTLLFISAKVALNEQEHAQEIESLKLQYEKQIHDLQQQNFILTAQVIAI